METALEKERYTNKMQRAVHIGKKNVQFAQNTKGNIK